MPPTDSVGSTAPNDVHSVLAGLELKPVQMNERARQQAALLAFGRRSNAKPPIAVLMEDAAAMVAEIVRADRIGVGEVVQEGTTLSLKVGRIDKNGVLAETKANRYDLDPSLSMAGYALKSVGPIASENLASEKRFGDSFLREIEVVAGLTMPLHLNGKPFGVLGVYADGPRQFSLDDVQFAETIAHLLTSSLARIRAEEELHKQRSFASTILDLVDTLVLTLDEEGRMVGMNRAIQEVTGFSIDEIRHRPFWNVFVVPEEVGLVQGIFRSAVRGPTPCEFEGYIVTKDGTKKRVSWSLKLMSDGKVQSIILSGIDKTEKLQTEAKLKKAKARAQKATAALRELCTVIDEDEDAPTVAPAKAKPTAGPGSDRRAPAFPFQPVRGNAPVEQRVSLRRQYQYVQKIAPKIGDQLPRREDFFAVQCNDISAGGISFFLDQPPDFRELVVSLGKEPALSHFTARVVRVAGVDDDRKKVYLVGCRFTGRIRC